MIGWSWMVPNDVELNNNRVELILPNDVELNSDRVELV